MELLTPGTGLIIWQLIIFVLLIFLLARMAWKPILGSLKEREQSIAGALDAADLARREISQLKADNEQLLQQAREERERILREAREISAKLREEAQSEAKKAADKIIDDARLAINIEKQAALKDVKIQVAQFSLQIAEKLLKQNLADNQSQKQLIERYLNDIKMN